jgi:FKBP-type peptidyl-prolyl cis-trans isomerase (trigger factor)
MPTQIKKLPKSQVEITGTISAEDLEVAVKKSLKHFAGHVEMPGFRKGSVPEKMVAEQIGEAAILEEAAEIALQEVYPKIIEENKIDAIGRPEVKITKLAKGNPLEFIITATTMPILELPDYKEIAAKAKPSAEPIVEEQELNASLDYIRKSRAKKEKDAEGKEMEILPKLTDEFAKSVGKFENVTELKNAISENIKFEKSLKARGARRAEILETIAKETKVELPDLLIHSELEDMTHEMKHNVENMGMKWEDYLANIKKTDEELRKDWHPDAERRVKVGLVMHEIGEKEKLEPTEEEVDKNLEQFSARYATAGKNTDQDSLRRHVYGALKNEAILKFLEEQTK